MTQLNFRCHPATCIPAASQARIGRCSVDCEMSFCVQLHAAFHPLSRLDFSMTIASTATMATARATASARTMSSMAIRLSSASSSSTLRSAAAPTLARHCHSHTTATASVRAQTSLRSSASSSLSRLHPSRPFCSATAPRRDAGNHDEQRSGGGGTPIGQIEQRLSLTFTCAVEGCGHRSSHEFAKRSYEKGIVIVQCPECKNR